MRMRVVSFLKEKLSRMKDDEIYLGCQDHGKVEGVANEL